MAETSAAESAKITERMAGILTRLQKEADKRVGKRQEIEKRWLSDLRQYHGLYDPEIESNLADANRSQLFINQTRRKTDAMSARISDLLFPTDDKNWGIQPTPVPRLTEEANRAVQIARQKTEQAKQALEASQMEGAPPEAAQLAQQAEAEANMAEEAAALLNAQIDEGKRRADLMSEEINDQLKESLYHAAMRDLIEDGCKIGTGVCKGPVTGDKVRKGWKRQPVLRPAVGTDGQPIVGDDGKPQMTPVVGDYGQPVLGDYALETGDANSSPAMRWVDIWSFFPDMDVKNVQDGEGVFERHLLNPKRLRALARLPGFDTDAIRRVLELGPGMSPPTYLAELRNISKENQQPTNDLFHVWEYSGPIKGEDLQDLARAIGDETMMQDAGDPDPLDEVQAVLWFCQNELLKLSIYPLDSYECMYSVFNLVKDESTVFGYGVPYLIRDPQRSMNAAWRMMMDNGGRSAGPMVYFNKQYIAPEDGEWTIAPWKVWVSTGEIPPHTRAFEVIDIPNQQVEMANIITLSKQFIDEMAEMPPVAQGEQGELSRQTFGGQVLQMNSANVVFRRIVKNFDDDVTTPNIRRLYDWNMQFNPKEEIKGDYEVDARGSSVLLVRELQAQSLMWIAMNLGAHPVFGPMLKNRAVLRKIFQTMMIPSDEVVLTDEEIDAILTQAAAQEAENQQTANEQQFKAAEMNMQAALKQFEFETRLQIAQMEREKELIIFANKMNMEADKLEALLADKEADRQSKERIAAAEAALTSMVGPGGGGYF